MLNFITQFLMHCIIKMPSKYLLVKFDMNYLFYAIFKIPMILCDFIINSGMIPWFFIVFSVGSNFQVQKFYSLYFPTVATKNACVVTSSEFVFGVPSYGGRNIPVSSSQRTCALPWGEDDWCILTARCLRIAWLGRGPSVNYIAADYRSAAIYGAEYSKNKQK